MLLKLIILFGLVIANNGSRISSSCCKSGFLVYHQNQTISCTRALLPNMVYNMTGAYLRVNVTDARKHLRQEITQQSHECDEIVFNEIFNSTQLSRVKIWRQNDSSRDKNSNSWTSSNIINVKKCCNHYFEYYDKNKNTCLVRKDYQSFRSLVQRYNKSFMNSTIMPMCKSPAMYSIRSADVIDILLKKKTVWDSKQLNSKNNTLCIQNDLIVDHYTLLICNNNKTVTPSGNRTNNNSIKQTTSKSAGQNIPNNNNNKTKTQSDGQNVAHNNKAATQSRNWTNIPKCIEVKKNKINVTIDAYRLSYNKTTHNYSLIPYVGVNNNRSTKFLICPHGIQTLYSFKLEYPSGNLTWNVGNYFYSIRKEDYCIDKLSGHSVAQRCYTTIKGIRQAKNGANRNFGFSVALLIIPVILTIYKSNHQ